MKEPEEPFARRTVVWLVGLSLLSMAAGILFSVFGGELGSRPSWGPSSFSPSARGHSAFAEVLRRLGLPLLVSRDASGRRASAGGVLVVAEPSSTEGLRAMIAESRAALLVLPKWTGSTHFAREDWVEEVETLPPETPGGVARELFPAARLRLVAGGGTGWESDFGAVPRLRAAQLMDEAGGGFRSLVRCAEGVLLAEVPHPGGEERRLLLLSDPDVLANHGLGSGENAVLAVAVLEDLRGGRGAVIIDETLHGFRRSSSLWRELLGFPLALVSLHGLFAAGLLAWAAGVRFGAPLPESPALAAGKAFLVDNTARLLQAGGHSAHVLVLYHRFVRVAVAEALAAPGSPGSAESVARLDAVAGARGASLTATALAERVKEATAARGKGAAREILRAAGEVHRWRKEMTRGS